MDTLGEVFAWRRASLRPDLVRPLLLDLYCGAGGAAMGYWRAGFDVIGIDIVPQPNYPFPFIQAEALQWVDQNWWLLRPDHSPALGYTGRSHFQAIHASPPCQRWSKMSNCRHGLAREYPDLIAPTRALLDDYARVPWVIENVEGAPLVDPISLCGFMFGRELYRHRLFEAGAYWKLEAPEHPIHTMPGSRAGHWTPGHVVSVSGHCSPMWLARQEMDIAWTNREELVEAVPPYYTEYVGLQLLQQVRQHQNLRKAVS